MPVDPVGVGLVELREELPRVGRERLDVAPLALGVERVEGQRALARAADARSPTISRSSGRSRSIPLRLWVRTPRRLIDRGAWRSDRSRGTMPSRSGALEQSHLTARALPVSEPSRASRACKATQAASPGSPSSPPGRFLQTSTVAAAMPRSRIGSPQREAGHGEAVVVHDAVAAAERQVLGEDREVRQLLAGDQLAELGESRPPPPAAMPLAGWPSRTGRS